MRLPLKTPSDDIVPLEGSAASAVRGGLVFVRGSVVDSVGHSLGNIFQRLYHLANRAKESDSLVAAELESSTSRLEEVLKLFLDYVSPSAPSLQLVPAEEVAQSLARQLGDLMGVAPAWSVQAMEDQELLLDIGVLMRCFSLIGARLRAKGRGPGTTLRGEVRCTAGHLRLALFVGGGKPADTSTEGELRWAVAERLVELQGGSLSERQSAPGETVWEIALPLRG